MKKACNAQIKSESSFSHSFLAIFSFLVAKNVLMYSLNKFVLKKKCYLKQPPEAFYKRGVLKKFTKFLGKQMCKSFCFFCNKFTDFKSTSLLKKRLWHICFLINVEKFFRNISRPLFQSGFCQFYI